MIDWKSKYLEIKLNILILDKKVERKAIILIHHQL